MDTPKSRSGRRPKRKRFQGNQFSTEKSKTSTPRSTPSTSSESRPASASSLKLGDEETLVPDSKETWNGYRVGDIDLILNEILEVASCKNCRKKLSIEETNVCGLSSRFKIVCEKCGDLKYFRNSEMIGENKNIAAVNRRFVYGIRSLGLGHAAMQKFSAIMDFPKPVSFKTYSVATKNIHEVVVKVSENSMKKAAEQEVQLTGSTDIAVSGDGSWQRRGHTSKNGVCTLIGIKTGKVVDVEVLSKYCQSCATYSGPRSGEEFDEWWEVHQTNCSLNHEGSSGLMEVTGMTAMFHRSEAKNKVRYAQYIGDGDSKTFTNILASKPYKDIDPLKVECVGHVQKRMGTRLRNAKKACAGKKLKDGKPVGGRGRLTDKFIDRISSFYGNAIRSHSNVKDMRDAVWAIWWHYRSTDSKPSHKFCPVGEESWCAYQKAKAKKDLKNFKHKNTLPPVVMDEIKPVFVDLTKNELLSKCVGGLTQNPNESLNNLIWKDAPKTTFCGKDIVESAVCDAALVFNDGQKSKIEVMKTMGLTPGKHMVSWVNAEDRRRILQSNKRALSSTKEARIKRRRQEKEAQESLKDREGTSYQAGAF